MPNNGEHARTTRKARIQKYLWDPGRRLFFDYDFETGVRSTYEYITTFYPLWAGLATPEQAQELVAESGYLRAARRIGDEHH